VEIVCTNIVGHIKTAWIPVCIFRHRNVFQTLEGERVPIRWMLDGAIPGAGTVTKG